MRGKSGRGGGVVEKSPRPSISPTSGPMRRYITQVGEEEGAAIAAEKQQSNKGRQLESKEKKEKKSQERVGKLNGREVRGRLKTALLVKISVFYRSLGKRSQVTKNVDGRIK